ncbi:hypothetical protein ABZV58_17740 [Nocardia sp. NPDC004654]|uniref:hypothetical protein n=1 Tax=Nocardia sp. NPDC004654 TaxID=3154776 RepID=UPI0033BA76B2
MSHHWADDAAIGLWEFSMQPSHPTAQSSPADNSPVPPLFADYSLPKKVWEVLGGPAVGGVICGVALLVNLWAYIAAIVLVVLAGLPAGAQHRTLPGALIRACAAGIVWAVAMLLVSGIGDPTLTLPPFGVFITLFVLVPTALSATISWYFGRRASRRAS